MAALMSLLWCRKCSAGFVVRWDVCPTCEQAADWADECPIPRKPWVESRHDWAVKKALWIKPEREQRDLVQ